jgi:putative ABC transport system substrate-binding protein
MNKRRKLIIALCASALAAPLPSFAQQPVKIARIGFLGAASASGYTRQLDGFRLGLRDFGYMEGKNIVIEYRWAEGNYARLAELAAELVRSKVDVIVTHGTPGTRAAKGATTTIPIVMAISGDAVATGLVVSLSRPGENITGSTFFDPELSAKRIELLKEILPRITRVAVLVNPDNPVIGPMFKAMEITAKSLKLELQQFAVRGPNEFENAFSAMAQKSVKAVAIQEDGMLNANVRTAGDLTTKKRLPAIGNIEVAQAGGLLGYGVNFPETFRRAAYFVDKILKGVKPADLPVEQPTVFELVINMKTAKALGIQIPQSVLLRANRVIE